LDTILNSESGGWAFEGMLLGIYHQYRGKELRGTDRKWLSNFEIFLNAKGSKLVIGNYESSGS
jgi:hypothetical protein